MMKIREIADEVERFVQVEQRAFYLKWMGKPPSILFINIAELKK